jgi:hypothetical protein
MAETIKKGLRAPANVVCSMGGKESGRIPAAEQIDVPVGSISAMAKKREIYSWWVRKYPEYQG